MNLIIIAASFLSGLLGAMGLGGGSVLIIYLTTFLSIPQKEAQGINLFFFLATGAFALISNNKKGLVERKAVLGFLPSALSGLASGFILLPLVNPALLQKLFAVLLFVMGVRELFASEKRKS